MKTIVFIFSILISFLVLRINHIAPYRKAWINDNYNYIAINEIMM